MRRGKEVPPVVAKKHLLALKAGEEERVTKELKKKGSNEQKLRASMELECVWQQAGAEKGAAAAVAARETAAKQPKKWRRDSDSSDSSSIERVACPYCSAMLGLRELGAESVVAKSLGDTRAPPLLEAMGYVPLLRAANHFVEAKMGIGQEVQECVFPCGAPLRPQKEA
eukprot:gene14077-35076_t